MENIQSFSENEKLVFETGVYLDDLKPGRVYIFVDNRLAMFVGVDNCDRFIFYSLASVRFQPIGSGESSLAHYDLQVKHLSALAEEIMEYPCEAKSVYRFKSMPEVSAEFPYVNFESKLGTWWEESKNALGSKIPDVVTRNCFRKALETTEE